VHGGVVIMVGADLITAEKRFRKKDTVEERVASTTGSGTAMSLHYPANFLGGKRTGRKRGSTFMRRSWGGAIQIENF